MKLRPLEWADVKIKLGWHAVNGTQRVYASLKGAAWIHTLQWVLDWKETPSQKATILLVLTRQANMQMKALKQYFTLNP